MIVLLTRASNNQPVSLTKQIASSGEGEVWETNLNGYLAKIYHNATTERIEKLKVMLANPPVDPMISFNHISIAWVSDLLKDSSGNYVGFLMPAIRNSKQLSSIYNPSRRKKIAPGFNWYYLHVTALNTAWIIQEIHAKGYVLGDIKTENILVNDRALVAVIDTDSFQVPDSQTGKIYRCTVGSEGFTPVELLGKDIATINQTETHDRFRLAVLIHYLLFGYHPFSGQWIGSGESPEQTELIRKGYWYAGQNSLIRPSQNTIPLDVVHPEVKKLFLQCFNEGHTQSHLRPTAQDWHNALQVAVNELTVCGRLDSHHYSRHYGKCYWCERAAKLGVDIFPHVASNRITNSTQAYSKVLAADKILDLVNQKGNEITVVGRVFSTSLYKKNTFFINFGNSQNSINGYRSFVVIIFSQGLQNIASIRGLKIEDLHKWVGKYIQITGILEVHQNKENCFTPQIILKESAQIKLITEDEANNLLKSVSPQASSTAVKTTTITPQTRPPSPPPQVPFQYRQQTIFQTLPTPNQTPTQSNANLSQNSPGKTTLQKTAIPKPVLENWDSSQSFFGKRGYLNIFLNKVYIFGLLFLIVRYAVVGLSQLEEMGMVSCSGLCQTMMGVWWGEILGGLIVGFFWMGFWGSILYIPWAICKKLILSFLFSLFK
jgi:serine/threonine protein kinase